MITEEQKKIDDFIAEILDDENFEIEGDDMWDELTPAQVEDIGGEAAKDYFIASWDTQRYGYEPESDDDAF